MPGRPVQTVPWAAGGGEGCWSVPGFLHVGPGAAFTPLGVAHLGVKLLRALPTSLSRPEGWACGAGGRPPVFPRVWSGLRDPPGLCEPKAELAGLRAFVSEAP